MDSTAFIVLSLACWRITSLLSGGYEDGPFHILHRIRSWVGVRYDEYSTPYSENEVGKLFACPWCMSVWVGLIVTLAYSLFPNATLWLFGYPFGLAGVIVMLHKLIRG